MSNKRYLVTQLNPMEFIISDTQDPGSAKLYTLAILPVKNKWYNTQVILALLEDMQNQPEDAEAYVAIRREIWSTLIYIDPQGLATLGRKILNSLEVRQVEIESPNDLAYLYGGQVQLPSEVPA